ncbi:protein STICHEL [Phalaenopsis equestris]|uniref:protein STICHEL n=1 Tax=Phalaenopsis equestris TaxID=78828 RepID=UPI0009E245E1|nr:protein STICHEL [Phalaenopsis equestris]
MVEKIIVPSELHLKKELTALRKARFLRDPETCSSWRSPLSSKSVFAYHDNEKRNVSTGVKFSSGIAKIPHGLENRRKKVYLCNWKNRSSISGESGIKLNEDEMQPSAWSSLEEKLSNCEKEEINDRKLMSSGAAKFSNVRGRDLDAPLRSSATRLKRFANSKRQGVKHSSITKQRNPLISPLGVLSSIEQSDDTEYCNSEDAQDQKFDVLRKAESPSSSASPPCPGSGCASWSRTSKIFRSTRREGSSKSCTPASTSSYYRKISRKPSTVGSSCGTSASFDGDGFDQLDLPVSQGCGLPCYRSRKSIDKGCRDCYSPVLSDTRKKAGCIFGRRQRLYSKQSQTGFSKPKFPSTSQDLPLLTNNCDDTTSEELSTNFGEIELEALSRLDGRRWSSCKSQEAFELAEPGEKSLDSAYNKRLNLMHKPRTFDEIIGQNIVVQSLMNAILRGRIAPAYLFHGPSGTGKKSAARIFAAALNCVGTEGNKPCYLCKECTAFYGESGSLVREASAANKKSIERVEYFLKNMTMNSRQLRYKVFIIDECHLLTHKMWYKLLRFLEKPIYHVVFIFITVDHDILPRAIISRVQKYFFSKIKDADMVRQLRRLAAAENLHIEVDVLNIIAANADGSLQNAEKVLCQLSAQGKRITTSLVNDLLGFISDEKLLDLLEVAISSNAAETVKRSRELMDSGVDPMSLLSQLAALIMDIISGTKQLADSQFDDVILERPSLTEYDLKRLEQALKILSDAEKQLKHSSEHSSILTTALLQIASAKNMESTQPNISRKHSTAKMNADIKKSTFYNRPSDFIELRGSDSAIFSGMRSRRPTPSGYQTPSRMLQNQDPISAVMPSKIQSVKSCASDDALFVYNASQNAFNLSEIWRRCIEKCCSKTLRQMLSIHGKLISLAEEEGILIAFIAFADSSIKLTAERYSKRITDLLEMVLKRNVWVRMSLIPDNKINFKPPSDTLTKKYMEKLEFLDNQRKMEPDGMKNTPSKDETFFPRKIRNSFEGASHKKLDGCSNSRPQDDSFQIECSSDSSEENDVSFASKGKEMEISVLNMHTKSSNKQKSQNGLTQAADNGASRFPISSNTDGNGQLYYDPLVEVDRSLRRWEDEQNREIKALTLHDIQAHRKSQNGGDKIKNAILPSLLHSNNFEISFGKENSDYDSVPPCSGLFCWKTHRTHRQPVKRGVRPKIQKASQILFCGQRVKSKIRGISRR